MKRRSWLTRLSFAMAMLGASGGARAATRIWAGGTGAWDAATNWVGGVAPGAADTASFTGWAPLPRSGWTLTASVGAGPAAAIDGSWGTRWTTGTDAAIGQWFQIDLGAIRSFSRLVLDDTNDGLDYPPGYDVYVSSDGATWGSPVASGAGSAPITTIDFAVQSARYVRVQLDAAGTNWWSIREAFVFTTASTDDTQFSHAGWTATASNNNANAGLAIDAALTTRWDTGTSAASGQWFRIDLGASANVTRVDFSSFTDGNDFPPAYKVQVSTDGVTFGANVATGTGTAALTSATFAAQTARYILITCTANGSNYWSIRDLQVYGTPRGATVSASTSIGALTLAKGSIAQGAGAALTVSGAYAQSAGTFTGGNATFIVGGAAIVSGGAFNVGGAQATFAAFTLSGGASFDGGTGTSTFSVSPTLTSGTFTVGLAGTTGRVLFSNGATFATGVTLVFPATRGEVAAAPGKTLTFAGVVRTATTEGATKPRIACNGCSAIQGVTIAFSSTSTLDVDGLELANSVSAGVTIASGATFTSLRNLAFRNNAGNSTSGTHLAITLGTAAVRVPGAFFDATATTNVALYGTAGQIRGARLIFELQSTARNGAGAGEAKDADGDNAPGDPGPEDNYGQNTAGPYYGSVVQWSSASPSDTAGTAEGQPTAAFDWNTFAPYGVYVEFKDVAGAGTADRLWLRSSDGAPSYAFDVPNASGNLVGTVVWSTENEPALSLDVNGDGDQADSVHVVYLGTTAGRIIKLIDNGTSLSRPASGRWVTDFTSASVVSISSPLTSDSTNLYFGGADASTPKIFGVQIAGGAGEKALARTIDSMGAVTAALAWKRISGRVYLYVGSMATLAQAHLYRVEVSPGGAVQATFTGATTSINGSVRLANGRALAVTSGGQLHALDAVNLAAGAFTNVAGFPYQTASAVPIRAPAWTDTPSGISYFGDDAGLLYAVTSAGANAPGYPLAISASPITSSPLYLGGSGVVAVGAADGFIYFVDRRDGAGTPSLFKRYYVGGGSVSSVAFNASNARYMVSSSDGKLSFIAASEVTDPTGSME